jgi:hypothetical protein
MPANIRLHTAINRALIFTTLGCQDDGQIMESFMQPIGIDHAADSRLRFIFSDRVVSLSLAADATFEDIARRLGEFSNPQYRIPVSIDVTVSTASRAALLH